jgi:hypothetical protein
MKLNIILYIFFVLLFQACEKDDNYDSSFYNPVFSSERYLVYDDTEELDLELTATYHYNADGYIIQIDYYEDFDYKEELVFTYYFFYDIPYGVVNSMKRVSRSNIEEKYKFDTKYNSQGLLVSGSGYYYDYDENGLLKSKIGWGDTIDYYYNNSKLIKQNVNYSNSKLFLPDRYILYSTKENGNYDTLKMYYSDNTELSIIVFTYSEMPKTIQIDYLNLYNEFNIEYVYDDFDRIVEIKYDGIIQKRFIYDGNFTVKPLLLPQDYELKVLGIIDDDYFLRLYAISFGK